MKTKNFLVAGFVGGIANFLLGWLFYGIVFNDFFPQPEESANNMLLIFLGCLALGLFMAYIFTKWAQITTALTGAKAGAIIGLFLALYVNFFQMAMNSETTFQMFALDVALVVIMGAAVGAIIAVVNDKLG